MAIDFVREMQESSPDDPNSLYYRANHGIDGVLVVQAGFDAKDLIKESFAANFRVTLDTVDDDFEVPRIETFADKYIGDIAIREFLSSQNQQSLR